MAGIDWGGMFMFDTPLLEIVIRGTVVYLALFILLRVVLRREAGAMSLSDVLVVVLIADAAQNAMAADYHSISDGLVLVATIVAWSYLLDWLGYHVPALEWLVHPRPLRLVQDGKLLRQNMRKELITHEELMSQLREQGMASLDEVREAFLEGDGQISFVKREGGEAHKSKRNPAV